MPVLVGELHSMLAPAAAVIHYYYPGSRLVYLMTDGAALPLAFSRTVEELCQKILSRPPLPAVMPSVGIMKR